MSDRFVPVDDLATIDEIADLLCMSVDATISVVTGRDGRYRLHFPKPIVGRAKYGVWLWTDVEAWYEEAAPVIEENKRRAARLAATTNRRSSWRSGRKTA